jgi:hypothetical protein
MQTFDYALEAESGFIICAAMPTLSPDEIRLCPKCSQPMRLVDMACGLPAYIDPDKRDKDKNAISTKLVLPVAVYHCPNCRYVELYG